MSQGVETGIFEIFNASAYKVGIVVAQFNRGVTDALLESALEKAKEYCITNLSVYKVAGCIEIPAVIKALADTKEYDCLVALGAIIRGETVHFDYVAKVVTEGALQVSLASGLPVGFGVLTCENEAQTKSRLNSGASALEAAVQSAKIIKSII